MQPRLPPDLVPCGRLPFSAAGRGACPAKLPAGLYLVGAGPGDPQLMTLRACELVRRADVVICDRLVYGALKTSLGREDIIRRPEHQHEVNAMVEAALARGRSVVRLKAGDPCVFGRMALEAGHFTSRGHRVHVVPGISSALAAPLYAGVITTMRGIADRVVVMTGTRASALTTTNIPSYDSKTTYVLLMSVKRIGSLTRQMVERGFPPNFPACVVQNVSTASVCRHSDITHIEAVVNDPEKPIRTPAVFVLGWVCKHRVKGIEAAVPRPTEAVASCESSSESKIVSVEKVTQERPHSSDAASTGRGVRRFF